MYQKLVEKGNVDGVYELIICYENGKGTEKYLEKASYWYQKATVKATVDRYRSAAYNLAQHYKDIKNLKMAFSLVSKSSRKFSYKGNV